MAEAILVCGSTGAGKTTYARALGGQIFSIDEWMQNLFWMDAPVGGDLEWALERVRRCELQIWAVASRLLAEGLPVVLDLGFSKREQRDRFRGLVEGSGSKCMVHYLDIPREERWARVQKRNEEKTGTYSFQVDQTTFNWMENYFEAPGEDEPCLRIAQPSSRLS